MAEAGPSTMAPLSVGANPGAEEGGGLLGRMQSGPVVAAMDSWAHHQPAFLLLIGDYGSGKTVLLRQVQENFTRLGATW